MAKNVIQKTTTNDVAPDAKIILRGKVGFCKIANPYIGESLEREQKRIADRNREFGQKQLIPDSPFYRLSLYDLSVAMTTDDNASEYFMDKAFEDKNGSKCLRLDKNLGKKTVMLCSKDPVTGRYKNIPFDHDLASGQEVDVVISFFRAEKYNKNGWNITSIIVNGDPEWFVPVSSEVNTLRELGYDLDFTPLENESFTEETSGVEEDDFSPYNAEADDEDVIDDIF